MLDDNGRASTTKSRIDGSLIAGAAVDRLLLMSNIRAARQGSPPGGALVVSAETTYPSMTPGSRVRLVQLAPHLRAHGVSLNYLTTLSDAEYLALTSPQRVAGLPAKAHAFMSGVARAIKPPQPADLLLVYRLRFLTPIPRIEPIPKLDVYDFDDALLVGSTFPWNRRLAWLKREAARCRTYLSRARLVIAGNSYLAETARSYARGIEVIPSCVDPSIQPLRAHAETDPVRIGWIGSASTAPYLAQLMPVFERLNANRVRAKLVVVGTTVNLRAPWMEHREWSLDTEQAELANFDIGVMPLPDDEWTRGKCGYKLLQYFAAAVPAVASPVGVNRSIIGNARGYLAETAVDWFRALSELINDVDLRREMGANGRAFVEREFSYQRWAPEYAALLRQL